MKITTKMNGEMQLAFQKHATDKVYKIFYIGGGVFAVLGILGMIVGEIFSGLYLTVFGVVFVLALPYGIKKANKKHFDSYKGVKSDKVVEFEFNDNYYSIAAYENGEQIELSKYQYDKIFKVEETSEYFFIYIASNMAHLIDKKDLDENAMDELRNIFIDNKLKYKKEK